MQFIVLFEFGDVARRYVLENREMPMRSVDGRAYLSVSDDPAGLAHASRSPGNDTGEYTNLDRMVPSVTIVIRDARMRSQLSARLTLAGCAVASADHWGPQPVRRMLRRSDWVVTDDAPAMHHGSARGHPFAIVLLSDGDDAPTPVPGCFIVPRQRGADGVLAIVGGGMTAH